MAIDLEIVKDVLRANNGKVSFAAKALGISRQALYKRINGNKSLQKVLDECVWIDIQSMKEVARNNVAKANAAGNLKASFYVLDRLDDEFKPKKETEKKGGKTYYIEINGKKIPLG